jgi:hypothetical protein
MDHLLSSRISHGNGALARKLLGLTLVAVAAALVGCRSVAFYEKEHLNDETMVLEESATETHFIQKVLYSREGSIGGVGIGAGGGCGCY